MAPPGVEEGSWLYTIIGGSAVFIGTLGLVLKSGWKSFRAPEAAPVPQGFILERGELANLGDLQRQLRDIGPKLDQIYAIDQGNKTVLSENNEYLRDNNTIMRRVLEVLEEIKRDGALRNRREDLQEIARMASSVASEAAMKVLTSKVEDAKKP